MPHQLKENPGPNWMLLTFAFISLLGWALGANLEPDPGLIDIGMKECNEAHSSCPAGYDLPVIRTKEELDRIYAHYENISKFYVITTILITVVHSYIWLGTLNST